VPIVSGVQIRVSVEANMFELGFALSYIALIGFTLVTVRSLTALVVLFFAGFSFSGVALQFASVAGMAVSIHLLRVWLLATLVLIGIVALVIRGRLVTQWNPVTSRLLLGLSGSIALMFTASRLLAPGSPTPLSSVGFFITRVAGEDNAKWLNATAVLADGSNFDAWANVGGPLVLLLSFCATFIAAFSFALYGAVNEVAVSSGSLIFAELLLIVMAPLALAPLAEKRFKKLQGSTIPWPLILLSGVTLTAGVGVLLAYGHLTLQYTLLAFVVWISVFLAPEKKMPWRKVTTLAVIATAMVWFPLSALAVLLIIGLLGYLAIRVVRSRGSERFESAAWLVATGVLTAAMFSFLVSSLTFSLGVGATTASAGDSGSGSGRGIGAISFPTLPLFSNPGGTEQITVTMLILAIIGVFSTVWILGGRKSLSFHALLPYAPILLLVLFLTAIFFADFWSVGDGPNYAALKMSYAVLFPILVVTLPFSILLLPPDVSPTSLGLLRWTGIGVVVLVLSFDTLYPRAVMQLKPSIWPSTAGSPYWFPAEVRDTGNQDLVTNPIGCVFLPRGAEQPTALPSGQKAYSCTRLLSGIAGVEIAAAPIVKWQLDEWLMNRTLWEERYPELVNLAPTSLSRSLILLDIDSKVVGVETLANLLSRYRPIQSNLVSN
jgi:hypothetical protein